MKLLISKRELIIQQARNKTIPYTFPYSPTVASEKAYSIKCLRRKLENKKIQENWVKELRFCPSKVT